MNIKQNHIDKNNTLFWNELCGSNLAVSLGSIDASQEGLRRFDEGYLAFYPYLRKYIRPEKLKNSRVLEIGLGYGTLGQMLINEGSIYHGIDIAPNPTKMMNYRVRMSSGKGCVILGSALELPFTDESFEYIYSIGCLHHTGNTQKSVREIYRILKPGGRAIIMLYNRHSLRHIIYLSFSKIVCLFKNKSEAYIIERLRSMYDKNALGDAAPHTDFVSKKEVRTIFKDFSKITIDIRNFDSVSIIPGFFIIKREWLFNNIARMAGLDLYITAVK